MPTIKSESPHQTRPDPRKTILRVCFCLFVLTVIVFGRVVQNDFINYDDDDYVYQNPHVKNGLSVRDIVWAFTTFHANNWHPLTWLSHQLDCQLFGLDPGPPHLVNVLFHAANAVLLFLLFVRLTRAVWPAGFVAAAFAWHPLHVESVAWVAERKDVLSTCFGLLTLIFYAHYGQFKIQNSSAAVPEGGTMADKKLKIDNGKGKVFYGLALLFFACGLMSKPMLVTWPFVMLLLDYWPLSRSAKCEVRSAKANADGRSTTSYPARRLVPPKLDEGGSEAQTAQPSTIWRLILEKWPFFALSAASCIVTYLAQRSGAVVSFNKLSAGSRVANALVSYVRYLEKIFWPSNLAIIYPLPTHLAWAQVAGAGAILTVISWIVWRARQGRRYLLVGWLWFIGTLVPVIGLIQVGGQSMADRYSYFPSIGVFIMLAYGFKDLVPELRLNTSAVTVFAALTLAALALLTERQLGYWENSETVFTHAIHVTANNDIALINLGIALEKEGEPEKALPLYYEALNIDPGRVEVHNNIANLLAASGHLQEAAEQYKEALQLKPNAPLPHMNLAALYLKMGKTGEALREYAEAARLDPADPRPHIDMSKACLQRGRIAEAIAHLRDALYRDPDNIEALTDLAQILASDEQAQFRDGAQAVALADKANALSGGGQPIVLDTVGMAYAEGGDFQQAEEFAQKAIGAATMAGETNLLRLCKRI